MNQTSFMLALSSTLMSRVWTMTVHGYPRVPDVFHTSGNVLKCICIIQQSAKQKFPSESKFELLSPHKSVPFLHLVTSPFSRGLHLTIWKYNPWGFKYLCLNVTFFLLKPVFRQPFLDLNTGLILNRKHTDELEFLIRFLTRNEIWNSSPSISSKKADNHIFKCKICLEKCQVS